MRHFKEKNIYIRPSNEIRLIKNLSESFHNALVESDAESKSIDATKIGLDLVMMTRMKMKVLQTLMEMEK